MSRTGLEALSNTGLQPFSTLHYQRSNFHEDVLSILEIGESCLGPGQVSMEDEEALQTHTDVQQTSQVGRCVRKHCPAKAEFRDQTRRYLAHAQMFMNYCLNASMAKICFLFKFYNSHTSILKNTILHSFNGIFSDGC